MRITLKTTTIKLTKINNDTRYSNEAKTLHPGDQVNHLDSKGYSTKQNPQGVFFILSSPIMILFRSPARENNS